MLKKNAEKPNESETITFFSEHCKLLKIATVFGLCLNENNSITNTAVFINKLGEIEGVYGKIHPFSYVAEDKLFQSGSEKCIIEFMNTTIGLSICYDLRFPELYRLYAKNCEIMVNIANWPERRIDHWHTLLKARAIENHFFFVGVNRIGMDGNGIDYIMTSEVYEPNGKKAVPIDVNNDIQYFIIYPETVLSYRSSFPVLSDIKLNTIK